jgi:uncharacterized repeat protein (TIGR01451 family)
MKQIILPFLLFFVINSATAQIVNIPDSNFKNALLAHSPVIDTNGDGEIQASEAAGITEIRVGYKNISSLEGIKAFTKLVSLDCSQNKLTTIDLSGLSNFGELSCSNNLLTTIQSSSFSSLQRITINTNPLLTSINLSNMPGLQNVSCDGNPLLTTLNLSNNTALRTLLAQFNRNLSNMKLTGCSALYLILCYSCKFDSLNLDGLVSLRELWCENNPLKKIDVSKNPKLDLLQFLSCPDLEYVNLKNGQPGKIRIQPLGCTNLKYVCADEDDVLPYLNDFIFYLLPNVTVNAYCSFTPGGKYNTIKGTVRFDRDGNGCSPADIPFNNLKVKMSDTANSYYVTTGGDGGYRWYTYAGNFTITPQPENPYFTFIPSSASVNFPVADSSVAVRDFCMVKNGTHNDLEITIMPLGRPRPGFGMQYQVIYTNKGTETVSGRVEFEYDQNLMTLGSASPAVDSQSVNHLNWNFTGLQPFQQKTINLFFTIAAPPVNNIGDVLTVAANINPVDGDETTGNNKFTLEQLLTGSFDPNDKTCLQGRSIGISKVGDYVHYLVRFQNLGTDTADNIVIKDTLGGNFNWSTVELIQTSHPCTMRQTKGNILEFIFQNILLPAKIQNDPASNGYVLFKVRSKSTLVAGDSLVNDAAIYFDFNPPVITNKAITKYVTGITVNLGSDIAVCGGPISLNAGNTGSRFVWSTGDTLQTLSVTSSGTYWVRVTNSYGFSASDTILVTLKPLPVVNLGADIVQCGGNVTLNAANFGSSYLWSNGATTQSIGVTTSGIYGVRVTNANGCFKSDTIQVTINPLPTVNFGADITQCGGNVTLNAGNAGSSYLWSNGATTQSISTTASGSYSVKVTNANGCFKSDTILVTINVLPVVNLGRDSSICTGSSLVLDAGNTGAAYLWNNGSTARTLSVSQGGSYSVRVTTNNGCSRADTIQLIQRALPVLQLNLPDTIYANDIPLQLNANPAGGLFSGAGVTNGRFNPATAGMGKHTIRYSYTDAYGCSNTTSATVFVNAPATTVNVFPNPNRGNFYVAMTRNLRNTALTIVTPSGQVVGRYTLNGLLQNIRLTLQPGLYYLKFSNTGLAETRRMMVW